MVTLHSLLVADVFEKFGRVNEVQFRQIERITLISILLFPFSLDVPRLRTRSSLSHILPSPHHPLLHPELYISRPEHQDKGSLQDVGHSPVLLGKDIESIGLER